MVGVGGAIATAGVSQVAAARVPDGADMVEIPKVMLGETVWKTKAVRPKSGGRRCVRGVLHLTGIGINLSEVQNDTSKTIVFGGD